jgi:hypothetical protein
VPRAILRECGLASSSEATIGKGRIAGIARAAGAEIDQLDTTPCQFSQSMDLAEYLVPVHAAIPELDVDA